MNCIATEKKRGVESGYELYYVQFESLKQRMTLQVMSLLSYIYDPVDLLKLNNSELSQNVQKICTGTIILGDTT